MSTSSGRSDGFGEAPPTYTIDLSLPPAQRYVEVVTDHKEHVQALTHLFDELVSPLPFSNVFKWIARHLLRKVRDKESNEELRGISKAAGIDLYLVVALNCLLDVLMGCTSGGVRVRDGQERKMLHFRTLDWGMNPLRKVVVQLDFVEHPGGEVIARSLTYVGFVGVLTGVRKDLSLSLNFRPYHNNDASMIANIKFYGHLILVLLGLRPSISSTLRDVLIPPKKRKRSEKFMREPPQSFDQLVENVPKISSTACYLILSNGDRTAVLEKDKSNAVVYTSPAFVIATNHDACDEDAQGAIDSRGSTLPIAGMQGLLDDSAYRKGCVSKKWNSKVKRAVRNGEQEEKVAVTLPTLKNWIRTYPILNEETHYACIMDPKEMMFKWVRRWLDPIPTPSDFSY